jgi:predicted dinucleotide-binding enzyme
LSSQSPSRRTRAFPSPRWTEKSSSTPNNYYPERDGHIAELDRNEISTSELLARHLPKSRVVKAFNAIIAGDIERDGRPMGSPGRRALPIAGNDPAAKTVVTDLLDQFGYDTVDAGPLKGGRRFQQDTAAYCVPMDSAQLRQTLADELLSGSRHSSP